MKLKWTSVVHHERPVALNNSHTNEQGTARSIVYHIEMLQGKLGM
jgi:hypothetical protein